ncbi:hypothetical protein ACOZ38_29415 [Sphaerisporangium viridialbum]|uniref:hypothetical protein n=1 Tax=Sphaerisporangium viridialbum TaxID=46189 RepID=UPI003C756F58
MKSITRGMSILVTFLLVSIGLGVLSSAANADVSSCSPYVHMGTASGAIQNGTLRAGFCMGSGNLKLVNLEYQKTSGSSTTIKLGYQKTNSSGAGAESATYGSTQTVSSGNTAVESLWVDRSPGCYHGVMLNTATGFQYVTSVWGSC